MSGFYVSIDNTRILGNVLLGDISPAGFHERGFVCRLKSISDTFAGYYSTTSSRAQFPLTDREIQISRRGTPCTSGEGVDGVCPGQCDFPRSSIFCTPIRRRRSCGILTVTYAHRFLRNATICPSHRRPTPEVANCRRARESLPLVKPPLPPPRERGLARDILRVRLTHLSLFIPSIRG